MNKEKDLIIVIPSYEPGVDFIEYAKEAAKYAIALVVIDDGSGEDYREIFSIIEKIPSVKLLSHAENLGKGAALRHAFEYCIKCYRDEKIIVTADCDGQHKIEDILKVFHRAHGNRMSLVLGSRDFSGKNVPKRSRIGNRMANAIYKITSGVRLSDTQTGLRGFSVGLSKELSCLSGNGFDFEMECLIYTAKQNIPIIEEKIETVYPENPGEHTSHYRPISDSLKIFMRVFRSMGKYLLSSGVSALLDVALFFFISSFVLPGLSWLNTLIATIFARIVSSFVNFVLNYKYVFAAKSRGAIFRYYTLAVLQMSASYGLVFLFGNVLGGALTAVKIIVDIILGFLSYKIQRIWVFSKKRKRCFFSPGIRFLRGVARIFSREYKCDIKDTGEGCVYVCRHLNMHGPYTTLKWLPFDAHLLVLGVFFRKNTCFSQYRRVTFGKYSENPLSVPVAFLASRLVPRLVLGIKAIPVYRDGSAGKTLRMALDYLGAGESIIVYPDKEYYSKDKTVGEIYDGFLYLGQMYFKKYKKELNFVPIYIDDKSQRLRAAEPVVVNNFRTEHKAAGDYIKAKIGGG